MQGDDADADADGNYFFFSAPASPVHYILRSPPSSTAASSPYFADADCCGAAAAAGNFEFAAAHGAGAHGGPAGTKGGVAMSSAEELFVAGRIRVGCLSPIRQEDDAWEDCGGDDEDEERDARSPRAARRARSVSPTRSPRDGAAEPSSHPFASASSSSSSSSAKNIRRRMSLRDLLSRTGVGDQASSAGTAGAEVTSRLGFWPPYIWPSRSSKKSSSDSSPLPCPAPQPGRPSRRSTSSDRAGAVPSTAKRAPGGGTTRRTTSLPYRQGLVLGCLGFGARGYGLAKSMHPLPSR